MTDFEGYFGQHITFKGAAYRNGTGNPEKKAVCPFHGDTDGNLGIDLATGYGHCFACGWSGTPRDFAEKLGVAPPEGNGQAGPARPVKPAPKPSPAPVLRPLSAEARKWLAANGKAYSEATLACFRVQETTVKGEPAIVFPAEGGVLRLYFWQRPKERRWQSWPRGAGGSVVKDDLDGPEVLVCEGEWDALAAYDQGFKNVLTGTTGAGAFPGKHLSLFEGKTALIAYDNDEPGHKGAEKLAAGILKACEQVTVKLVDVPAGAWEGKDVSDFFSGGNGPEEFAELLAAAKPYEQKPEDGPPLDLEPCTVGNLVRLIRAEMDRNAKRDPSLPLGLTTGWPWLDKATEGFLSGTLWVLGAYTSTGKTAWAVQAGNSVMEAHPGVTVAFFSLEMSRSAYLYRLAACRSGVPALAIRKAHLEASDRQRVSAAFEWLATRHLYLFDSFYLVERIAQAARALKSKAGLDVLFLDYFQNLGGDGSLFERMSRAAPQLQALAKELECCIVGLSQVSNEATKGEQDFIGYKGGGDLAAASDVGLWLERNKKEQGLVTCYLRKNREGPAGLQKALRWTANFTRLAAAEKTGA